MKTGVLLPYSQVVSSAWNTIAIHAGYNLNNQAMDDAERDRKIREWQRKARSAAKKRKGRNLYVITLDPEVLWEKEFRQENPGYIQGLPCVYVGMTIHEPGDRFEQHRVGYRSSKYPRNYGVELALELMEGFDGEGLSDEEREAALAEWLRGQGCAVWQN